MFRIMRNKQNNGTSLSRITVEAIRRRLPPGWMVELRVQPSGVGELLYLCAPNGQCVHLTIISRQQVLPKDVPYLMAVGNGDHMRILIAPFLSPRTVELLTAMNACYADGTGNLRLVLAEPAVYIESQGASRDPYRQPRPLRSLKGPAAARVVRALCDLLPPYGVRMLADKSETPLGTVSRVVTFLDEEALITRDEKKVITAVDWRALIQRWVVDYSITGSNTVHSYLEPRGLSALAAKLSNFSPYAVTGSMAVPMSIAPARLAMIYVENAEQAAEALELVPTDAGSNVWLIEPFDAVVFERTQTVKLGTSPSVSLISAAASQVVADLMTSPGRGPQEADSLIEWMIKNETSWRRKP